MQYVRNTGGYMRNGATNKGEPVLAVRLGKTGGTVRRRIKRAARLRGVTLSEFVRRAAIREADAVLGEVAMSVPPRHTAECGDETDVAA